MAEFINELFYGFDYSVLSFYHRAAEVAGNVLTPLAKIISLLGEKGIVLLLAAFAMMLFAKYRKSGICLFGAVCCGALITNIILKDSIARIRPFGDDALFEEWWKFIGSPAEDSFSFPSGHATAISAGMVSLCLTKGKKLIIPSVVAITLMCASRNYLMVHYPSDVLAGFVVGAVSALIAFFITKLIYYVLEKNKDSSFCSFIMEKDIINIRR